MAEASIQSLNALLFYATLLVIVRLGGKRLAGQTSTFDLMVLITLGVVIQTALLRPGPENAAIFVASVFVAHKMLAILCARSPRFRRIIRGAPRILVRDGKIIEKSLLEESISRAELLAGLRKLGHSSTQEVRLAVLEETGHISVISRDEEKPI